MHLSELNKDYLFAMVDAGRAWEMKLTAIPYLLPDKQMMDCYSAYLGTPTVIHTVGGTE